MKKLICVLLTLFVIQGYSQRRVLVDELINKGTEENPTMYFNGALFNGVAFALYEDGQLAGEVDYEDGKPDGLVKVWYENGQLQLELDFEDGKPDGLRKSWYENGQLAGEENYIDGKLNGLVKTWYENGQLKGEGYYKDGIRQ